MVVAGIFISIIVFVYRMFLTHIPPVQFLFLTFLIIFLLNYCIMRDAEVTPFVKEDNNIGSKFGSVFGFIGIISVC